MALMDRVVSARLPYVPVRLVVHQQVIEVEAFLLNAVAGKVRHGILGRSKERRAAVREPQPRVVGV